MKKYAFLVVIIAVVALAAGTVGVAYAKSPSQATGTGTGWMNGNGVRQGLRSGNTLTGDGILHDYMIAAYAQELNIPVTDLETRLESGETMAQIALSTGLTIDQFRTLMIDVRSQAIDQALSDGVLTQAQADWMNQRGAGQMAGGRMGAGLGMRGAGLGQFANPDCPYYNQVNP